jgi:hypothetical protein
LNWPNRANTGASRRYSRHLAPGDRPILEAHLAQPDARRELILLCSDAWLATQ